MIAPSAPWPFVGRDRELAAVLHELEDPASGGALIVGPAGVGKTRVLDEVAVELGRRGRLSNRAVGATATQAIPYAAIAHLLPKGSLAEGGAPDPMQLFVEISTRVRAAVPPGERFVMAVDDVALLDTASLALCTQLVHAGVAALLATVRHGQPVPPALTALEGSQRIARIEIAAFDVDGVIELLEAVQGGTVDRHTSRALWGASQGNLLYLRELVLAALASGAMTSERGHWRLVGPLTTTSKLVEAVGGRLDGLPAAARELAEALALAEPLRIDDLEVAGLGDAALELDGAGLVHSAEVDGDTVVRLAHPLYGEVLRSQLTPLRRRSLLLRAARAVAVAGRSDDALRLATWLTAAGTPVDPAILKEAAGRARAANDFALTEQLARAAVERAPDLDLLVLLGEAVYEFGRIDEADRILATAADHVRHDVDRLRLAVLHHRVRLWGRYDVDGSVAVLRDAAQRMSADGPTALLRIAESNTLVFADHPASAMDVLDPGDVDDPVLDALAGHSRAIALIRLGDPVQAAEVAAAARAALDVADARAGRTDRVDHPALLMNAQGLALTEVGDLDGAEAVVREAYALVVEQHIPQMHAWLSLMLGRIALRRGRPASARRWFAEGLAVAVDNRFGPGRRMALTGLAVCAGHVGDVLAAATLLAELDQLTPDLEFLAPEVELGRAWALVALGRQSDATRALRAGAARAAGTGDATVRHQLLYETARISGDGATWAELREVEVTGPFATARATFVEGLAGSRAALLAAEEGFAAVGAELAAAEAAAALAADLTSSNRPREAAAASAAAARLEACEGASTPALLERPTTASLTAREREIAMLAARGLASKAIARQLGVAERTVSNHLQNAYVKLGISTRADLEDALGL